MPAEPHKRRTLSPAARAALGAEKAKKEDIPLPTPTATTTPIVHEKSAPPKAASFADLKEVATCMYAALLHTHMPFDPEATAKKAVAHAKALLAELEACKGV